LKLTLTLLCTLALTLWSQRTEACGCFTPPDPTVPVVQAGERILFAVQNGEVTAHVQVQYSGASGQEFGWLLPLPSVPTLELGTDELFALLTTTTQPRYLMNTVLGPDCQRFSAAGGGAGGGNGGFADAGLSGGADAGSAINPLVVQDSVGPYDYAVLRADSKTAMLDWLAANRYFVPAGTDDSVAPYIRPGAFFLALKLRAGNTTGDLQPVVLHYASDLGVIPITLTSTGAEENMRVQVWMLGDSRAIPRNYNHTIINDAVIDWPSSGANYDEVVIRAVGEAPGKHAFVTEYAGPSTVMRGVLTPAGRFGTKAQLAAMPTPADFVDFLFARRFTAATSLSPFGAPVLPGPLKAILVKYLPPPQGMTADTFFTYYRTLASQAPQPNFQPQAMADEIWDRVVLPVEAASALFDRNPTLTRLYSTISPADMNKDPAFSFNPSLPMVSNVHLATMNVSCERATGRETSAVLTTEQGWALQYPNGRFAPVGVDRGALPASLVIEVLREEGAPQIVVSNVAGMEPAPKGCGCQSGPGAVLGLVALLMLLRRSRRAA
jgi:MYXO-CTERM domain-containing protein